MECKKEQNLLFCNCSYSCEKKGMCCDCIKYHRQRQELPACYFDKDKEELYDRSLKNCFNS